MRGVLAIAEHEDRLIDALEQLRLRGYGNFEVFSPMPVGRLLETSAAARGQGTSPIRWFTLAGALTGLIGTLALTYGTSLAWPLLVGGKPIVAFTGFSVIVFEGTILLAGVFTVVGFLLNAGLFRAAVPNILAPARYSERFSVDSYGLFVACDGGQIEEVVQHMRRCGLEEISIETA